MSGGQKKNSLSLIKLNATLLQMTAEGGRKKTVGKKEIHQITYNYNKMKFRNIFFRADKAIIRADIISHFEKITEHKSRVYCTNGKAYTVHASLKNIQNRLERKKMIVI